MRITKKMEPVTSLFPEPKIRTVVIPTETKKWKGCIYLSVFDHTGLVILFLESKTGLIPAELKKVRMQCFTATTREELDSQMSEAIRFLLNKKRSANMPKSA